MNTIQHIFLDNSEKLTFVLTRKRIRNIIMRWDHNNGLKVSAPLHTPMSEIIQFILSKQSWLYKIKTKTMLNKAPQQYLPETLQPNALITLCGNVYTVEILPSNVAGLFIQNDKICIHHPSPSDQTNLNTFFQQWLTEYTVFTFQGLLELLLNRLKNFQIKKPLLKVRKMRSSWGICRLHPPTITINSRLIHTPLECIEFVMAHELAHLKHFNHSKQFYELLEQLCPDWKTQKNILKTQYSCVLKI